VLAADTGSPKKAPAKNEAAKKKDKEPSAKAKELAAGLSTAQKTKLMGILNEGDDKTLASLPGVGPVRSVAIKAARPYAEPLGLFKAVGVGEGTFAQIINHAKADFPAPAPKAKRPSKKKESAKKAEEDAKK
ncbi:MAG: hypothetical protein U0984_09820, partial [Prosthecobacter sp.]|nr:hypothetical protein [Prosthecobacter sp.]